MLVPPVLLGSVKTVGVNFDSILGFDAANLRFIDGNQTGDMMGASVSMNDNYVIAGANGYSKFFSFNANALLLPPLTINLALLQLLIRRL